MSKSKSDAKKINVKSVGPVMFQRNEPPALYLREVCATGTQGKRTIECCIAVPRSTLVFDVTDEAGKAQYVVTIGELVEHVGRLRDGFLERATAPAAPAGSAGQDGIEKSDVSAGQARDVERAAKRVPATGDERRLAKFITVTAADADAPIARCPPSCRKCGRRAPLLELYGIDAAFVTTNEAGRVCAWICQACFAPKLPTDDIHHDAAPVPGVSIQLGKVGK